MRTLGKCLLVGITLLTAQLSFGSAKNYRSKPINPDDLFRSDDSMIDLENAYAGYGIDNVYNRKSLWPNGVIPYYIEPEIREDEQALARKIRAATETWRTETGGVIRFIEYTDEDRFERNSSVGCRIVHRSTGDNAAYVGVRDPYENCVFLKSSVSSSSILHELGHVIGLYHEHCRSDRDSHIDVHWDNIVDSQNSRSSAGFGRGRSGARVYLNYFDWDSIMLYPSNGFSRNGKDTLTKKYSGDTWVRRGSISSGDVATVKAMYNAPSVRPRPLRTPPRRVTPPTKPRQRDGGYGDEIKRRLEWWKKHGRF